MGWWSGFPGHHPLIGEVSNDMRLAVSHIPTDAALVAGLAREAEAAGLRFLGVADSPQLYGSMYPMIQVALGSTERIPVGPCVTNPVTRHPTVHGADLDTLESLFPGRTWLAMGAGDSAVHSIGLPPASPVEVGEALRTVRSRVGPRPPMLMAVSGPRAAACVPAEADGVLLGGGLDAAWLTRLTAIAEEAAGHRLERWAFCSGHLVERSGDVAEARATVRASVIAVARHGLLGDPAARGVPEHLVEDVLTLRHDYDFSAHARGDGGNARLLARHPEAEAYLTDRFALVGTPQDVAARLSAPDLAGVLDGVVLSSTVPDPIAHVRLLGRTRPLLADPLADKDHDEHS